MERRKKRARGMYEEIERDRIGKTYTERVTQTETHRERGMLMCVLHPKGSLTQYGHSTGGQSTARVHWPKSLLFTHTHTHNPSKQYSCKHLSTEDNRID